MSSTTPAKPSATLTEVVLPGVVEPDGLVVRQRSVPRPATGQALVEMRATGVSFGEQAMRRGRYPGQPKFPFVLGYDLVGVVAEVGGGVDRALVGRQVAAVTKTGGWTTHALLDARDLVPIPEQLDPAEVETLLLNGITAWQMLHRKARAQTGETILVHGASGSVATTLVQLARHAGIRVIATASPRDHDELRALGAEPVDYAEAGLADRVRALAPDGVAAVFDHLGGASFRRSFDLLARDGTLVGYGTATQLEDTDNQIVTFVALIAKFAGWSLMPNGRRASFYDFWGGKHTGPKAFRERLAADLTSVLALLEQGTISARVAARLPLREAAKAMTLAESRTVRGKVVLVP